MTNNRYANRGNLSLIDMVILCDIIKKIKKEGYVFVGNFSC